MTDAQAIHRLKDGDIDGLDFLIKRYQLKALRAAFLITHDEQIAEEVVQETFVRFFQRASRFDANRPFEPYLLRSVVNAALNATRERSRWVQVGSESDLESFEGRLSHAITVEAQVEFNQVKHDVLQALAKLPPRQRAVIVQRYYLQMSEKEMAEDLNAAARTIKRLLSAARERLRRLLGNERSEE